MTSAVLAVANLNVCLLAALVAGLLVSRRHRLCRSFLGYACACLLSNRLVAIFPETFFTPWFWTLKESVYVAFKFAVAAEIGLLTFWAFPRARRIFWALLIGLGLVVVLAQLLPAAAKPGDIIPWVSALSPRGQAGMLWILAGVVSLAAYYRIPLHPFHRGVLLGFALYLGAYTVSLALLREVGVSWYPMYAALDPAAFAASVGVWTWSAWRRNTELTPELRRLQPWASAAS